MKIAIVCGAKSSEFMAPFDDESYEIWVLGNRLDRFLDKNLRFTRIFEIHDYLGEHSDPYKYVEWLSERSEPLIVGEKWPIQKNNIEIFPYDEAQKKFGSLYLTSSPAYMVQYALLRFSDIEEIAIYGVDLTIDDHEYFYQRACMEYWCGFVRGAGIKLTIPDVAHITKSTYVEGRDWEGKGPNGERDKYGHAPFTQSQFLQMAEAHEQRIELEREKFLDLQKEHIAAINSHSGASQAYRNMAKTARAIEGGSLIENLDDTRNIL